MSGDLENNIQQHLGTADHDDLSGDVEQGGTTADAAAAAGIGSVSLLSRASSDDFSFGNSSTNNEMTLDRLRALLQEIQEENHNLHSLNDDDDINHRDVNGNPVDDDADDDDEDSYMGSPCCERCLDVTGRLLCVPIAFVVTVVTVITVISFCVLPSIVLIGSALAFYYCCTSEPIPVRILLRAMLFDDAGGDPNGALSPAGPRRTKAEIHALLLRRQCLAVAKRRREPDRPSGGGGGGGGENEKDEKGNAATAAAEVAGDFVVETTDRRLIFSEPLAETDPSASATPPEDNNNDNNNDNTILQDSDDEEDAVNDENDIELVAIVPPNDDIETGFTTTTATTMEVKEEEKEELTEINLDLHNDSLTQQENMESDDDDEDDDGPLNDNDADRPATQPVDIESPPEETGNYPSKATNDDNRDSAEDDDNLSESSSMMQHERGTACDICLRLYRPGDIVAWSLNPACDHAYHCDCITDWLLHNSSNSRGATTCPNCRSDFLYASGGRNNRRKSSLRRSSSRNNNEDSSNHNEASA